MKWWWKRSASLCASASTCWARGVKFARGSKDSCPALAEAPASVFHSDLSLFIELVVNLPGKDGRNGTGERNGASLAGVGVAVSETDASHALAEAALFKKVLLQPAELLVTQVVGLVD